MGEADRDQDENSPTPEKAQVQVCRSIEGSCPTVFFAKGCLAYLASLISEGSVLLVIIGMGYDGIDLIFFAPFT